MVSKWGSCRVKKKHKHKKLKGGERIKKEKEREEKSVVRPAMKLYLYHTLPCKDVIAYTISMMLRKNTIRARRKLHAPLYCDDLPHMLAC
jgi:hypothetical protein